MNTNFQTFHQMGSAISDFVKQATGRDNVQNIDMDHVTVAQNHVYDEVDVSGRVVQFSAGAEGIPFEKCIVQIVPVQDLHGYDHPWPAGGGANKASPIPDGTTVSTGVTLIANNGKYSLSGSSTAIWLFDCDINLPEGEYSYAFFNGEVPGGSIYLMDDSFSVLVNISINSANKTGTFTLHATAKKMRIRGTSGNTYNNVEVSPMIVNGTTIPTAFAPYSNICPITGWTMVNLYQAGQNLENARVFRFTFPSEAGVVYGGTLDVVTGELVVDAVLEKFDKIVDGNITSELHSNYLGSSGSVTTIGDYTRVAFSIYSDIDQSVYNRVSSTYRHTISNMLKHYFAYNDESAHWYRNTVLYAFFPTSLVGDTRQSVFEYLTSIKDTNPFSVWLELSTPITYQLTPQEVRTLLGQNNIWADTGDIEVKFTNLKELY